MNVQDLPEIVDAATLAKFFGVTTATISIWRRAGSLPEQLPLPGKARWSRQCIADFLANPRGAKAAKPFDADDFALAS